MGEDASAGSLAVRRGRCGGIGVAVLYDFGTDAGDDRLLDRFAVSGWADTGDLFAGLLQAVGTEREVGGVLRVTITPKG